MSTTKNDMAIEQAEAEVSEPVDPVEAIQLYVSQHKSAIGRLISGEFEISTLNEAEKLSTMLAANTPCPEKASLGFWELLSNAVEHGNLEIDMQTKAELMLSGGIEEEIERRLNLDPYRNRVVRVSFECGKKAIRLKVCDQGKGFDYKKILRLEMPLDKPNGRGIHVARNLCFDSIKYEGCGNIVTALINL